MAKITQVMTSSLRSKLSTGRKPIKGTLLHQTEKAFLISTGIRTAWIPKRSVTHDPATGVFTMPVQLAARKLLD